MINILSIGRSRDKRLRPWSQSVEGRIHQTAVAAKVASPWVTAAAWAIVIGDSTAGWLGGIVGIVGIVV
ncbi:MAG: hypothetical protein P4M09_00020, partial [Devosia sp.]|nr:hypothetical protein [Devosia sp.]